MNDQDKGRVGVLNDRIARFQKVESALHDLVSEGGDVENARVGVVRLIEQLSREVSAAGGQGKEG